MDRANSGSVFTRLNGDIWLDTIPYLDYYGVTLTRFVSSGLNRLLERNSKQIPLRVIQRVRVKREGEDGLYIAETLDSVNVSDIIFTSQLTPEGIVREVADRCMGAAIRCLICHIPLTTPVTDFLTQLLSSIPVMHIILDPRSPCHVQLGRLIETARGLEGLGLVNDREEDLASVLQTCVDRDVSRMALHTAGNITDEAILDFSFRGRSEGSRRDFTVMQMNRSLSDGFFHNLVEKGRRNVCKPVTLLLKGLTTDPTDPKYSNYVVERGDTHVMHHFTSEKETKVPFIIVTGTQEDGGWLVLRQGETIIGDFPQSLS